MSLLHTYSEKKKNIFVEGNICKHFANIIDNKKKGVSVRPSLGPTA
jgi:hypothetical protein